MKTKYFRVVGKFFNDVAQKSVVVAVCSGIVAAASQFIGDMLSKNKKNGGR